MYDIGLYTDFPLQLETGGRIGFSASSGSVYLGFGPHSGDLLTSGTEMSRWSARELLERLEEALGKCRESGEEEGGPSDQKGESQ